MVQLVCVCYTVAKVLHVHSHDQVILHILAAKTAPALITEFFEVPKAICLVFMATVAMAYSENNYALGCTITLSIKFWHSFCMIGGPQLMVTPVNSTTVTVSWSEAQCFSGTVTHYLVQYQSLCSGVMQNVTTNGLVRTVTISDLIPNCVYTFRVAAVGRAVGTGQMMESFSSSANMLVSGESMAIS